MTIQTSISTSPIYSCPFSPIYSCRLEVPYTGTQDQPDIVSLFFKNDQNQVSLTYENIHSSINYKPLNFQPAIDRIKEAVNKIFLKMKGEDIDLWNATKNLTRGIVALVPLIGNATLYLYDRIKTIFYINSKIKHSLSSQNGPILGIAFDGKVMSTFSLADFYKIMKLNIQSPHDPLVYLRAFWQSALEKSHSPSSNLTRNDLINKLNKRIENIKALKV